VSCANEVVIIIEKLTEQLHFNSERLGVM